MAIDLAVDLGISGHYVTRVLDQAARFRGYLRRSRFFGQLAKLMLTG